ncbi:Protein MON2 like protein [Verticillium longisporum]|nr:Protein MON2 like protein [Verticillium longisporum]
MDGAEVSDLAALAGNPKHKSSLQLICSDFLTSLPNDCFLILVDTLYKFSSQYDDLNIALTTVTFFWVLSDHLSGKNKPMSITTSLMDGAELSDLAALAGNPKHKRSFGASEQRHPDPAPHL